MEHDLKEGILPHLSPEYRESRTSQLDDLLLKKLEGAFHRPTQEVVLHELSKIDNEKRSGIHV